MTQSPPSSQGPVTGDLGWHVVRQVRGGAHSGLLVQVAPEGLRQKPWTQVSRLSAQSGVSSQDSPDSLLFSQTWFTQTLVGRVQCLLAVQNSPMGEVQDPAEQAAPVMEQSEASSHEPPGPDLLMHLWDTQTWEGWHPALEGQAPPEGDTHTELVQEDPTTAQSAACSQKEAEGLLALHTPCRQVLGEAQSVLREHEAPVGE
jgi:hypothetical protein